MSALVDRPMKTFRGREQALDGKLALSVVDMRLAQVDGLMRHLMGEAQYQEPLSLAVALVRQAHGIVRTLRDGATVDGSAPPDIDGTTGGATVQA